MNSFIFLCFCYVSTFHPFLGFIVVTFESRFVTGSTQSGGNVTGLRLSSAIAPPLPRLVTVSSPARFVAIIHSVHFNIVTPPLRSRSATTVKIIESSGSDFAPPPGSLDFHRRLTPPTFGFLRATHCSEHLNYFRELRLLVYVVYGASPTPQATTTSLHTVVTFFTLRLEMAITISGESFASGPRLLYDPVKPLVPLQHHFHIFFNTTTIYVTSFSFYPLLVAGYTVQECGLASFACYYVTVASPTHYAVSSIDGSSQSEHGDLQTGSIVQECGCARISRYYVTAAPLSYYAVSNIDGSSQSQLYDFQTGSVAQRPNHPKAFCFLSDVCSHMLCLNKCDDWKIRSFLATTCWAHHGNVEFRGVNPIKPLALSSNFIPSAFLEVKVEFEIHIVSSVSLVGLKGEYDCFSFKSSQLGLRTRNVVYGSGTSHLEFLTFNIQTSNRCINVVFDYQLFVRTIAMGTKVELPYRFLHFAELDSPRDGLIFTLFVMLSRFVLLSSLAPGSSASVVNFNAH